MLSFIERFAPEFQREHIKIVSNRCFDLESRPICHLLDANMYSNCKASHFLRCHHIVVAEDVVDFHGAAVRLSEVLRSYQSSENQ